MCRKCEEYYRDKQNVEADGLIGAFREAEKQMSTIAEYHLTQPPLSGFVDGVIRSINIKAINAVFSGDVANVDKTLGYEVLLAFYTGYYLAKSDGALSYFSCEDHVHGQPPKAPSGHSMKDFDPKEFGL